MKKGLLVFLMLMAFSTTLTLAQCLEFAGGPYSDQAIEESGCDGQSVSAPYQAWGNELYFTNVLAGGNYTFGICDGYDAANWGAEAEITAIFVGLDELDTAIGEGEVTGGTVIETVTGCTVTVDAEEDGVVYFVLSPVGGCGGDLIDTNNGTPTITTNSGVPCEAVCGNGECELGESFETCPEDCPCETNAVFAGFDAEGSPVITEVAQIFCETAFTGGEPFTPAFAYVPMAVLTSDDITTFTESSDDDFAFFELTEDGFIPSDGIDLGFLTFMQISNETIAAAGDNTTVTFTSIEGTCVAELTIDWTVFGDIDLDAETACGPAEPITNDLCVDALPLDVTDGAVNGEYSNNTATGEEDLLPPDCFVDGPGTGENFYDNSIWFTFEGDGATVTLTTDATGATNPLIFNDTQMAVFEGECDGPEVACNDDIDYGGGNFMSSVTVETVAGTVYYVVVDGFFYGDGMGGGGPDTGDFFILVESSIEAPDCEADFGSVIPPDETTICQDGLLGPICFDSNDADGYLSTVVVTTGDDLSIVGLVLPCETADLTGLAPGDYIFHPFNFLASDTTAINGALEGGATGVDVAGLIADGVICADLDVAGVPVTVLPADDPACGTTECAADFGTVTPPETTFICQDGTLGAICLDGNNTSEAFGTTIVVTTGPDLQILGFADVCTDIDLSGLPAGDYIFHAFNFLASDTTAIFDALGGGATGVDVAGLIADGVICADLDVAGVPVLILPADDPACASDCEADYGDVIISEGFESTVCPDESVPVITVTGNNDSEAYATVVVLTTGAGLEIVDILDLGGVIEGGTLAPGDYILHAFNFLAEQLDAILAAVEDGATGVDVAGLIAEGAICADLDVDGVPFTVLTADDAECVEDVCEADYGDVIISEGFVSTVCPDDAVPVITVEGNNDSEAYATVVVLTTGAGLEIVDILDLGGVIEGGTLAPGDYILHAFNFLAEQLDAILAAVEDGATGVDVAGLIADGAICADLDVEGVPFTVLEADDAECSEDVCEADYGDVIVNPDFSEAVCPFDVVPVITVEGNNGNEDYVTVVVLTTGEGLAIVDILDLGADLVVADLESGLYTLHAFNFLAEQLDAILDAVEAGATGVDVAGLIADGTLCADLDATGVSFTILSNEDEICNLPPEALDQFYPVALGTETFTVNIFDFVSDINGDDLTITFGDLDQGGTIEFDPITGELTYTPEDGFEGLASVSFTVSDGFNDEVSATITYEVALTCESLNPIEANLQVAEDPENGNFVVFAFITGGLPEFDGSTYTIQATDEEGNVLPTITGAPAAEVFVFPTFNYTVSYTMAVTITDDLGCSLTDSLFISDVVSVEFLGMTATTTPNGNAIEWTTASETNSSFFTLYYSNDGNNFEPIYTLNAAGNSSVANTYNYVHATSDCVGYYRLTQTDFDGTTYDLGSVSLRNCAFEFGVSSLMPVPATDILNVNFTSVNNSDVRIDLFSVDGKLMKSLDTQSETGYNNVMIDVSSLASGVYFISLSTNSETVTESFVKK